ncbi:MAG: type I restriction enzyme HsdR N-terminal domain-containing protein [Bacteroidales bacterium]|nr:type I restriction enzyme HsdR N-terminal domain-containing protein [Bacteroidales bacterium]
MVKLNLPEYTFEVKKEKGQFYIRDIIRKKYLLLTPEEWVRQNITAFLTNGRDFPAVLFSMESGIKVNSLQKRYDALVYSRSGSPLLLIECKAPEVAINQKVFEQIIAYNNTVKAPYMLVTNGILHYFLRIDNQSGKFVFDTSIPFFTELLQNGKV